MTRNNFAKGLVIAVLIPAVAFAEEPKIELQHLGWIADQAHQNHYFSVTLSNPTDDARWFVLPIFVENSPPKQLLYINSDSMAQPFGGSEWKGDGGSVVALEWRGQNSFNAIRVASKGRLHIQNLRIIGNKRGLAPITDKEGKAEITIVSARELHVNETTLAEKWVPYSVTSDQTVQIDAGKAPINLGWDAKTRRNRTDYRNEVVKSVKAVDGVVISVPFKPASKME